MRHILPGEFSMQKKTPAKEQFRRFTEIPGTEPPFLQIDDSRSVRSFDRSPGTPVKGPLRH